DRTVTGVQTCALPIFILNSDASKTRTKLESDLVNRFGIILPGSSKAHPPPEKWWSVFKTIFEVDPNSLVHGVLFPQWQIKIPREIGRASCRERGKSGV